MCIDWLGREHLLKPWSTKDQSTAWPSGDNMLVWGLLLLLFSASSFSDDSVSLFLQITFSYFSAKKDLKRFARSTLRASLATLWTIKKLGQVPDHCCFSYPNQHLTRIQIFLYISSSNVAWEAGKRLEQWTFVEPHAVLVIARSRKPHPCYNRWLFA